MMEGKPENYTIVCDRTQQAVTVEGLGLSHLPPLAHGETLLLTPDVVGFWSVLSPTAEGEGVKMILTP